MIWFALILVYSELIMMLNEECKIPWQIERIIEQRTVNTYSQKLYDLDIVLKRVEAQYYIVLEPIALLDNEFFANIDEAINDKLLRFCVLKESGKRGAVVNTDFHNKVHGNELTIIHEINEATKFLYTVLEKAEYMAKRDNQEYMIKTYEEICLPQE